MLHCHDGLRGAAKQKQTVLALAIALLLAVEVAQRRSAKMLGEWQTLLQLRCRCTVIQIQSIDPEDLFIRTGKETISFHIEIVE